MNDPLADLLGNFDVSSKGNNAKVEPVLLNYCCDTVLNSYGKNYILGNNQLFPIYDKNFINGGWHDIKLYLYTALKWRDMLYTDTGEAVQEDDEPYATLGYGCGIDIFKYRGSSPCVARNIEGRTLTIDQWCRLTHDAMLAKASQVMPRLWMPVEIGGHKFWTPDKGTIRALPVDIPMVLDSAEEFCTRAGCQIGGSLLLVKLQTMLYKYMQEQDIDRLYIGYNYNPSAKTEEELIPAEDWSMSHSRRLGEIAYDSDDMVGKLSIGNARKLAMAINNLSFHQEDVFA